LAKVKKMADTWMGWYEAVDPKAERKEGKTTMVDRLPNGVPKLVRSVAKAMEKLKERVKNVFEATRRERSDS
jgi:hypothetical protein